MTYSHTGSTAWTDVTDRVTKDLSINGGVELVAAAANTGLCYYSDQKNQPTGVPEGFPVRLDNPAGVFIPTAQLKAGGRLWVNLTVSGDYLGIRAY